MDEILHIHLYECGHVWLKDENGYVPANCPVCDLEANVRFLNLKIDELENGTEDEDYPWEDDDYDDDSFEQWWNDDEDDDDDWDYYRDVDDDFLKEPIYGIPHPGCSCSRSTDEYHGWECTITDGECMFLSPDSKQCAKEYGEGPDAKGGG